MKHSQDDREEIAVLHEFFSSATHDASAAMCRWTDGLITISLDEVRQVAIEDALAVLDIGDEQLTMVVMTIDSDPGGSLILIFDEINSRQLAELLLGHAVDSEVEWSDVEKSALTETGNILGCAYVNALTRLTGADLIPSPPYFIRDFGASVLEQALMTQAMTSDSLLLCQIGFHRKDKNLDWRVVFMPTQRMQDIMGECLHAAP